MREREPREGNAKSFVEREGHSRDLTVQTAPWPSHAATFTMQHSFIPTHVRSKIYAIAFTPTFRPHLCSRIHDAPFTLHLSRRIHAAVHMLPRSLGGIVSPLSLRSIDAAALTLPHLCRRFYVPARTPPHARRMHATAFTPGAALMLPPHAAALFHRLHISAFMQHLHAHLRTRPPTILLQYCTFTTTVNKQH